MGIMRRAYFGGRNREQELMEQSMMYMYAAQGERPDSQIHPHFQKLFHWRSKFDWFCLGLLLAIPFMFVAMIRSFF